ncbi:MAG: acetyl-CoA carboxylase biotin carboxyl carrier protein [Thermoanaerobaculum sp.]|nr:acetyl-CoA carboxylase biotin carboxyl carrier protein [Thermoanaerobaculum sp.]MDW7966874.1 acetyl-CoA carboxylase biotin carboxyl carrier protein [Thermoanaerobaculum sp.]
MFSFDEICQLIRLVAETRVGGVELERDGAKLRIDGVQAPAAAPVLGTPVVSEEAIQALKAAVTPPIAAATSPPPPAPVEAEEENLHFVTSPIVGTFYRAPNPDAEPFVQPGDRVRKGQVLCIVEAMKLMNEIESDVDGVVVKVYPENAQPVEFGERLFAIRVS